MQFLRVRKTLTTFFWRTEWSVLQKNVVNKISDRLAKVVFIKISPCIIYDLTCLRADDFGSSVFEILGFSIFWPLDFSDFLCFSSRKMRFQISTWILYIICISRCIFKLLLILRFRVLVFLATYLDTNLNGPLLFAPVYFFFPKSKIAIRVLTLDLSNAFRHGDFGCGTARFCKISPRLPPKIFRFITQHFYQHYFFRDCFWFFCSSFFSLLLLMCFLIPLFMLFISFTLVSFSLLLYEFPRDGLPFFMKRTLRSSS